MRRTAALVLTVALTLAACSKAERPALDDLSGSVGPSEAATETTGPDTGASATTGTDGSTTVPAAPTDGAGAPSEDPAVRAATAERSLTAYFDALRAEDFATAQQASAGGARFMARIRDLVARYNAERDGVSRLTYATRSFQATANEASRVAFTGSARLDSTVSGPAGDPHTESALFENPVVAVAEGAWRVTDYAFDGKPIVHHAANASKQVGGVTLRLSGALAFGSGLGLILDLAAEQDHGVRVEDVRLALADGTSREPRLGVLISGAPAALYFRFDGGAAKPVSWTGTVTIDADTPNKVTQTVTLRF